MHASQAGGSARNALLERLESRFGDVDGQDLRRGDVGAPDGRVGVGVEGGEEASLGENPTDRPDVEDRVSEGEVLGDDFRHRQRTRSGDDGRGFPRRRERFEHRRRDVTRLRQDLRKRRLRHGDGVDESGGRKDGPGHLQAAVAVLQIEGRDLVVQEVN